MAERPSIRVALVGDRSPAVRAHECIPRRLAALARQGGPRVEPVWIDTDAIAGGDEVDAFAGVWAVPGSPYRSAEGALAAIRTARERGVPFLGTCGGFQHAVLELARDVCGIAGAAHAEEDGDADEPLIDRLACSLVGQEGAVDVVPGSLADRVLGPGRRRERYHCSFGLNPAYRAQLEAGGLRFSGFDDAGEVRIAELPGHPFFLCTLFQPELAGGDDDVHPIIAAFAAAAAQAAVLPA